MHEGGGKCEVAFGKGQHMEEATLCEESGHRKWAYRTGRAGLAVTCLR